MPNLPTHFSFALETLDLLGDRDIRAHLGSFLLGSTTPDIRARTKLKRSQTHFAPLSVERVGTGVDGMFSANPQLYDAARNSAPTRAFLAGYVSHLVTDETWIIQVYRPYFGNRELFPDPMRANVWDRALQLEMDRNARADARGMNAGGMDAVIASLRRSDVGVDAGFIDSETLNSWQGWVTEFCARPFAWDRLRFLARRMYRDGPEVEVEVAKFLESPRDNLERVYRKVPRDRIRDFRESAVTEAARHIKERLNAD